MRVASINADIYVYASDAVNEVRVQDLGVYHLVHQPFLSEYTMAPSLVSKATKCASDDTESRLQTAKSEWERGLFKSKQAAANKHQVSKV